MSGGPGGRRKAAGLAVLAAVLTGAAAAATGASMAAVYGAGVYLALTGAVLLRPAALAAQVVVGQLLVAAVLLDPGGPPPVTLLPVVAGVVATAELLALAARLDGPFPRDAGAGLREAALATLVGSAAYGAVALLGALPGPSGLAAVALASGACLALALVLVRAARQV